NDSAAGGAQAMFYLATQFIEHTPSHNDIYTQAGRHADRWGLNLVGYSGIRLYFYSMHLKASSGNQAIRLTGVQSVVDDIESLPIGSKIIVAGDMNFYNPSETGYQWFINEGGLVDPLGNGESWAGGTNSIKHSQSPLDSANGGLVGGGLDDRFDFQFVTAQVNDGNGFAIIPGTYRSFGNDGDHYNQAINAGNNYYFPGDTARGNALANQLIDASDHLPLIVDYQVPALLDWTASDTSDRVLVDSNVSIDLFISNIADAVTPSGADLLSVTVEAVGDIVGNEEVSVLALSAPEEVSFPIDTTNPISWQSTVTLTVTSEDSQAMPEVADLSGEVIEHANASFAFAEDIDWYTYDIVFEANTGVQSFNVWLFNFGFDGSQSLLEIDDVTIPDPPIIFGGLSTTTVGSIPALMEFSIDTDVVSPNIYTSFLPITVSDENLVGEQSDISMLTVRIEITPPIPVCSEDLDGDGQVAVSDILVLIADWGGTDPAHDLDGNGTVGVSDLLLLIAAWGPCE
ncbi:MAG: hypothetical protein QF535_01690, partial [Anaerolineales bacterium]|nr:hypothetical protein [Anaerolineales bacterium]